MSFNKLINLKLQTKSGKTLEIKTPVHGIKPQIEISGSFTMEGFAPNFEIRITNLYTDEVLEELMSISVSAGYEGKLSAGINGTVQNCYTEVPGPDKVTVISCVTATYDVWITSTINMKLKAGFTLSEAIKQITEALGYDSAIIDSSISANTCTAPFYHNGKCTDAIAKLRGIFPGVSIISDGHKLKVFPTEAKLQTAITHTLNLLTQAPQFSGNTVSIIAPWDPMIKPGDYVQFPINFSKTDLTGITFNKAVVNTLQFNFATNTDTNEMIISGSLDTRLNTGVS